MSLYKESDIDLLKEKADEILEIVTKKKLELLDPNEKEIRSVTKIIMDFIKNKKRKIYGGYALNMLIKEKNVDDAIYKNCDLPDIDFYSPEPIKDLIELCNLISGSGFKYVVGFEAMHKETYSIRVHNQLYCDISYVPKNIYNTMQFVKIGDHNYIHPHFMTIDYFRMFTDPLTSYWRVEKSFKRFYVLQKHYPLPTIEKQLSINDKKFSDKKIVDLLEETLKYIKDNDSRNSMIVVGLYAYNYFINESKIKDNNIKMLKVPFYEIISSNFGHDANGLINRLKIVSPDINVVEHYPYFQFLGHSVHIYYKDSLIAIVYHYNRKCLPYLKVDCLEFENNNAKRTDSKVTIGTFILTLSYLQMNVVKARTDDDEYRKSLCMTMISHLIKARNYYNDSNKSTIFSKNIFREFITECVGAAMTSEKERMLTIESRKKKNKKPLVFRYDPADGVRDTDINYVFANSSGNPVKNPKNLKLSDISKDDDIEGADEEDKI